ncbi:endonuclease [Aquitalea magnusonii]|uniref:Deoxyribonuclease-1 n=1 Tax=Aquitalea magnusonii TaxID=332411 RepID=A0A318JIE4_9NEIS|nr:endonuclease [Aquitalea magnusonii]PXX50584.1 deoxyribonuclease-1 [Aquitalea magnusonii]
MQKRFYGLLLLALCGCDRDGGVKLPREVKALAQLGETMVRQLQAAGGQTTAPAGGPADKVVLSALVRGDKAVGHRDFNGAKRVLPKVFAGMQEDFYCGCAYQGKAVDWLSCGYVPRKNPERARRIEWEHVVPAWVLGHQRQCWQQGGRKNCSGNDEVYRLAEGDLNNLVPAVGEVNADRSNLSYSAWARQPTRIYGQCGTVVDFAGKRVQPREEVRGRAARITLYMHQRYALNMSRQDRQLMCAWARQYPVDSWETRRNARIVSLQGEGNFLVSQPARLAEVCG